MRFTTRRATAMVVSAMLAASLTAPAMAQDAEDDWPFSGPLRDGSSFTLKQSIADKLALNTNDDPADDVPIQYVFSYGSDSIPLFSPQYRRGYERSIPEAQAILPSLSGTPIAPASALQDVNLQIAQIQALHEAGLIDCLSIQSTGDNAFTNITNEIMA
ncbi:hypothetical protein BH24CHL9_BH24CHL9_13860 [soil metagenome]